MKESRRFIDRLRRSDDATKRVWIVFFTLTTLVIILGLWALYAETIEAFETRMVIRPEGIDDGGFLALLERAVSRLGRTIPIGRDSNFIYDDLMPVLPTPLP